MFLNAGWLGGALYLAVVVATTLAGFLHALKDTPWRGPFIAVYAGFVGTAGEGIIIDTDHWRHFFVLSALVWGMMAAPRLVKVDPGAVGAGPALRSLVEITGRRHELARLGHILKEGVRRDALVFALVPSASCS